MPHPNYLSSSNVFGIDVWDDFKNTKPHIRMDIYVNTNIYLKFLGRVDEVSYNGKFKYCLYKGLQRFWLYLMFAWPVKCRWEKLSK